MSSFARDNQAIKVHKQVFAPIMPLDNIIENLECPLINMLSIDVEGLNYEVLKGSALTLQKSLVLCIEYDTEQEKAKYQSLLGSNFKLLHSLGCNLIYLNSRLAQQLKKT